MMAQREANYSYGLDAFLPALGIHIDKSVTTDPVFMQLLLSKVGIDVDSLSKIDPFGILIRLKTEKIPLAPLIESSLAGISHNTTLNQSLIEIAEYMGNKNKVNGHYHSVFNKLLDPLALHIMVILEVLTLLMANNKELEQAIFLSMIQGTGSLNPGSSFWNFVNKFIKSRGDLFVSLKQISLDPSMFYNMCWRKYFPCPSETQLNEYIKAFKLSGFNQLNLKRLLLQQNRNDSHNGPLCGNMLEAVITEKRMFESGQIDLGAKDNAKTGFALIVLQELMEPNYSPPMFTTSHVKPRYLSLGQEHSSSSFWVDLYACSSPNNSVFCVRNMSEAWVNLYQSWDLAFVLRNYQHYLQLTVSKLIIPIVMSVEPDLYLSTRIISLWLAVNFSSKIEPRYKKHKTKKLDVFTQELINVLCKNNLADAKSQLRAYNIDLDQYYEHYINKHSSPALYLKALQMLNGGYMLPPEVRGKIKINGVRLD